VDDAKIKRQTGGQTVDPEWTERRRTFPLSEVPPSHCGHRGQSAQSGTGNVNVNVEFKVTLHEQVRYSLRGALIVLKVTVCHTAGHYGEEYDD